MQGYSTGSAVLAHSMVATSHVLHRHSRDTGDRSSRRHECRTVSMSLSLAHSMVATSHVLHRQSRDSGDRSSRRHECRTVSPPLSVRCCTRYICQVIEIYSQPEPGDGCTYFIRPVLLAGVYTRHDRDSASVSSCHIVLDLGCMPRDIGT
jgi:hypothetical protein